MLYLSEDKYMSRLRIATEMGSEMGNSKYFKIPIKTAFTVKICVMKPLSKVSIRSREAHHDTG
jgi:hypothetical protein